MTSHLSEQEASRLNIPQAAFVKITITDLEMVDAYISHGSVWKAADALGVSGQTVHRRLSAIGATNQKRVLTANERDRIISYYRETQAAEFSLSALSTELGRTRQYISRKAREFGLTDTSRERTTAQLEAVKRSKWAVKVHPRGALGMKHSEESKKKISEISRREWVKQKALSTGNMSPENRQKKSDFASLRASLAPAEGSYSRTKGGRRADIGNMYFRSAWEANYARYLNWLQEKGQIDRWQYEPEVFWFLAIKRGVRSYKPDFQIFERGSSYFVEVKGWMDPKSKTKLKRMKKYYPDVRVDVVGPKQYAQIKSAVARMIEGWE